MTAQCSKSMTLPVYTNKLPKTSKTNFFVETLVKWRWRWDTYTQ